MPRLVSLLLARRADWVRRLERLASLLAGGTRP